MTSSCLLQNVITAILHGQHGGMISAIHKKKQGHVLDGLCNSPLKLILRLFYWVSDSERTSLFFFFFNLKLSVFQIIISFRVVFPNHSYKREHNPGESVFQCMLTIQENSHFYDPVQVVFDLLVPKGVLYDFLPLLFNWTRIVAVGASSSITKHTGRSIIFHYQPSIQILFS
jgi:hypothetical protein